MSGTVARGLALFGIGLGVWEIAAPRQVARLGGLGASEREVRAFGVREVVSGVVILLARRPENWLWTRVAGDTLDGILLGGAWSSGGERRRLATRALWTIAPVVLLDAAVARRRR